MVTISTTKPRRAAEYYAVSPLSETLLERVYRIVPLLLESRQEDGLGSDRAGVKKTRAPITVFQIGQWKAEAGRSLHLS